MIRMSELDMCLLKQTCLGKRDIMNYKRGADDKND